jgi:uncharacterized protein YjbI with pentapeptide repeats
MNVSAAQGSMSTHRHALCVGIGKYTELTNHDLLYATSDAQSIHQILADPVRGACTAKLLITPEQTTKKALSCELKRILNPPDPNDLVIIYLSCHGEVVADGQMFCMLPSDTIEEVDDAGKPCGKLKGESLLNIKELTTLFTNARAKNIIMLLDTCYSGAAGDIFSRLPTLPKSDDSIHIIGAAQRNHTAKQSSILGHGIFTAALLDAVEQKPNGRTQWITIYQVIDFLQNRIYDYQYSEYEPVHPIQVSSLHSRPLDVVKNPRYSNENAEFAAKVTQLLAMRSYHKEDMSFPPYAPANFFIATVEAGLKPIKEGIIPIYNKVEALTLYEVDRIADFVQKQAMQGNLHRGMIVLALNENDRAIREYNSHWLTICTIESIENSLINFVPYLQDKILKKYEVSETQDLPPLAKIYVPLNATEAVTEAALGIEQVVRQWLADDAGTEASARLAILADYGSGKSTFCTHLAAMLAKEHLEEQKRDGYSTTRIPLLISLKDFAEARYNLQDYVISYLKEDCSIESARRDRLLRMADGGQLLFLLDGFDEMASKATAETLKVNINYIEQLARGRNKVLVTTRQEFLLDSAEEQDIFRHYRCFSLSPFDVEQIKDYVGQRIDFIADNGGEPPLDWKQRIETISNLSDLLHRPVWLQMIFQTLPDLLPGKATVRSIDLYHLYIYKELSRHPSLASRRGEIGAVQRLEIMQRMALEIYRSNRPGLSIVQIHTITRRLLTAEQLKEIEGWLRELAARSLLTRKRAIYEFSHESFMEYLIACQMAKAIQEGKRELFELKKMSRTIKGFLIELEEGYAQEGDQHVRYQKAMLLDWFRLRPQQMIFSANIFTLLVNMFTREELQDLPLRNARLAEADLSHAQLQQTEMEGVHLERGNLEEANLQKTNLANTTLRGANLDKANLQGANLNVSHLEMAHLVAANLNHAELVSAYLMGTHLQDADLTQANLMYSRLEGANLEDANLEGANLQGANLEGANLEGANLHKTNMKGAILRNAVLKGALHLKKASLQGADLTGAILPDKEEK